MNEERTYGHLPTDDLITRAFFQGMTRAQLEQRCPWWRDTTSIIAVDIDCSLPDTDESAEAVAKAEEQWRLNVENNIPGLAVSPLPYMFMVRVPKYGIRPEPDEFEWEAVGGIPWDVPPDRSKWEGFSFVRLNDVFDYDAYGESWSYAAVAQTVAPNADPHRWDLPNPRLYWPSGKLVYMNRNDRFPVGPWLQSLFRGTLELIWGNLTMSNNRTERIRAFLDHHMSRGGAPKRFIEYVESLVQAPPAGFDAGMVDSLQDWASETRSKPDKGSTTLKGADGNASRSLTIPVIARICWCMFKAGADDHRIVNRTSADRLAVRYQKEGERTGERLKKEWDLFFAVDGDQQLKYGQGGRESHGRKMWDAVRAELEQLGQVEAASHAKAILNDI